MSGSQDFIDPAREVRAGEELDLPRLEAYLRAHVPALETAPLEVLQFPSGHSNLTYLLRVGSREMVLRRPPFGAKIKTAHDMQREHHILACLESIYPLAPLPLVYCDDESVLGAPFYVMERIQGIILRANPPEGLELSPGVMQTLSENFVDNLLTIHQLDYASTGLAELGHPEGYVRRQVEGWSGRYINARTDDLPAMDTLTGWLSAHLPADNPPTLIHNDYKYDNLVLEPGDLTHILGVLDWEMATIGDPLMDLGTSLGYWVQADDPPEMQALGFGLTSLPGNLTRRQVAERYAAQSRLELEHLAFYYAYALYKIAVIVQQIYARYKAGFSHDPRFARMIFGVNILSQAGLRVIQTGQV